MLKLYNTLSRKIEAFSAIGGSLPAGQAGAYGGKYPKVGLYTCGPTVYDFAHIGNLRTYIFEDSLHRVLAYNGYQVDHAMNITDVGHLTGDGDEGEDKLEVGAKREGKSPLEIARIYEKKFFDDLAELNIIKPNKIKTASDSVDDQKEIIGVLLEKGFAYEGEQAIYFDTSKFFDYGKLSGQKLSEKKTGARGDVIIDSDKKHPADFALWFFLTGRYKNHILHWPSPWGEGFPGWHIECSAISRKLLGQPFDIHAGGVDHIGTHHANEIAQSEAAFGVPLANLWLHGEFLLIDSSRMGKSEGNLITLDSLKAKGFSPLDFRYFCLTAHYRTQLNFTWEALLAARTSLEKMREFVLSAPAGQVGCAQYEEDFLAAANDDLNIPKAIAMAWKLIDDKAMPQGAKINSMLKFDKVFGLNLDEPLVQAGVSQAVSKLLNDRQQARDEKDFAKSDELRKHIESLDYEVMDTPEGQKVKKKIKI